MVAGGDGSSPGRPWPGSSSLSNMMSACFAHAAIFLPARDHHQDSSLTRSQGDGGSFVLLRPVPRETHRGGLHAVSAASASAVTSAPPHGSNTLDQAASCGTTDRMLSDVHGISSSSSASSPSPSEALRHRDYDPSRDVESMERICRNVYNGRDYLPRVIDSFVESPADHPMVIEDEQGRVTALGNVQVMPTGDAWLQAIRVCENAKGRGHGTEITKILAFKSFSMGCKRVLSSTTPSNPVMRRIFEKLGFRKYDTCWVWMVRPTLSARGGPEEPRGLDGRAFLDESGLATACGGASAEGFEECRDVDEAKAMLRRAGGGEYVVGEYRVHSLDQELGRAAVEGGRFWARGECVAMAWPSPELKGNWFLGVVAGDAGDAKGAILKAAEVLDEPFGVAVTGNVARDELFGALAVDVGESEFFEKTMHQQMPLAS